MSRLAFRAAAAVVGVALLAVYLAAAAFVADALLFLWATRPPTPRSPRAARRRRGRSARRTSATGSGPHRSSRVWRATDCPASARPTSTIGSTHSRLGWLSTARRCTSPTPGRRTRSRSAADRAAGPRDGPVAVPDPRRARGGGNRRARTGAPRNERTTARARDGRPTDRASSSVHHGACAAGTPCTLWAPPPRRGIRGAPVTGQVPSRGSTARSRTDCSPASYSRLSSPGRGRASGSLRPTTVRLR